MLTIGVIIADIDTLLQDLRRYSNAHKILLAERDEARGKVEELQKDLDHKAKWGQQFVDLWSAGEKRIERLEGALRESQDAFVTKCAENFKARQFLQFVVDDYHGYKPGQEPTPGLDCVQRIEIFLSSGLAAADGQQAYIVQGFWSPCRKYIASVHISNGRLVAVQDDNGDVWEPTGPAQEMAKVTR